MAFIFRTKCQIFIECCRRNIELFSLLVLFISKQSVGIHCTPKRPDLHFEFYDGTSGSGARWIELDWIY